MVYLLHNLVKQPPIRL